MQFYECIVSPHPARTEQSGALCSFFREVYCATVIESNSGTVCVSPARPIETATPPHIRRATGFHRDLSPSGRLLGLCKTNPRPPGNTLLRILSSRRRRSRRTGGFLSKFDTWLDHLMHFNLHFMQNSQVGPSSGSGPARTLSNSPPEQKSRGNVPGTW